MRRQLLPALRMTIALIVLLGFAYPLAMTGAAQALFRGKANGSLIARNDLSLEAAPKISKHRRSRR